MFILADMESSAMGICEPPLAPSNGRIEPNNQTVWLSGDTVRYNCTFGFVLEGEEIRVCGENGSFNGTTPECVGNELDCIRDFCNQ